MHPALRRFSKAHFFNYDKHGKDWNVKKGEKQSPVALSTETAIPSLAQKLKFINYNKMLVGPLKITNNGHTVIMSIPVVVDGNQPAVCGCKLKCLYKAVQLHFHWGSPENKGSEHMINCCRYDAEMHILHQNCAYALQNDAIMANDGFVVLSLMLRSVPHPKREPSIINRLLNELIHVRNAKQTRLLRGNFCLRDFVKDVERDEFFVYKGSLTTPPCREAVNWIVFTKPINVSENYIKSFWSLRDYRGSPLVNNYRSIQKLNHRCQDKITSVSGVFKLKTRAQEIAQI
ncbi:putative carbonic anhydrase 3 [Drosophila nasuta]|uniref:Carbonic anhydrase n=1 Tax=Drosophila albomicans TaxID=7291 RepID=A0A6P8XJJ8_DROAB|nr:putative carbonic anhydrase 3 [Drosophila albomicans]XP_060646147.1 putative carbonic anhydrase 3 [Drosophila nasuta]